MTDLTPDDIRLPQPAVVCREHKALDGHNPQTVVLDRDGIAWQKWGSRWYSAVGDDRAEVRLSSFGLAQLGPVTVVHEGVNP